MNTPFKALIFATLFTVSCPVQAIRLPFEVPPFPAEYDNVLQLAFEMMENEPVLGDAEPTPSQTQLTPSPETIPQTGLSSEEVELVLYMDPAESLIKDEEGPLGILDLEVEK